ncbi:TetR/AcrR family transcriptional regulator [Kibdelosporangium aridum]|nr:TetR/AcrR family transcriptional regulator [Kibdelosporangium aridum]
MTTTPMTERGIATRGRIVSTAADLILERGARGTSLDDIRAATKTSKSQLFHYFPGGKSDLVDAVATLQAERVLEAQRPFLDHLDTWESWLGWRDALLAYYETQPLGCPIGALSAELARTDPDHAATVIAHMERWRSYLEAGLARMVDTDLLQPSIDPRFLSMKIFSALHGGLALMTMFESVEPLRAGLDAGLAALREAA